MKAFSKFHPVVLIIYFVSVIGTAMFLAHPVFEAIALTGAILFCFVITKKQDKLSDLKFYIPLFLLIAITNPLFSHNGVTPLFFMNGNAVTLEAILYGIDIAVMLVSVMLWCKAYSIIMTSDKFVYLFGRIIPKLSLVLSMALRYVPMLKRQAKKVSCAQKAMGLYSSKSIADRVKFAVRVFSALVGWSLENAVETGRAMKARGYGLRGRTNYSNYYFLKTDALLLAVCISAFAAVVIGRICGCGNFSFYPRITEIGLSGIDICMYSAFAVMAFLPFIIEIEEVIRWKYYRSKI